MLRIDDDISRLPASPAARDAITELHFHLVLSRLAAEVPPKEIWELRNLRRLHLQPYGLEEIPSDIAKLTELRELTVDAPWDSKVGKISEALASLPHLESLTIHTVKMKAVPDFIARMTKLRTLKFIAPLESIPDLSGLHALETLWLRFDGLVPPAWIATLPRLVELRLERAPLPLPDWLWSMGSLRRLGLVRSASPTELPKLARLPQLEGLSLKGNGLKAIPDLGVLTELRSLEVTDEPLEDFPQAILRKGARLEVLTLSKVGLKKWPEDVGLLTELRELDVSENALKALPEALTSFDKLEILRANENAIVRIPDDIGRLRNLHTLELRKNKIVAIPESIGALRELATLDLGTNRIPSLPASFFGLSKLRTLSLQNNLLETVPDELARLGALESLLLQTNPATRGKKNQAAEALLKAIHAAAANGEGKAASGDVDAAAAIALRTQIEIGDLARARALALADPKAAIEPLIEMLEAPLAKLRTRALGLLAEVLPDPFKDSLEGAQVSVLGKMGTLKTKTVKTRLASAGATLVTSAEDHAGARRVWVVGELPGLSGVVPEGVTLAALPQLQAWLVADAKPHLMQAAPSHAGAGAGDAAGAAESLGELLRSPVLENVQLGLKLADEGGVPTALHPLLLALARAHGEGKVRKHAARLFDTYADAGVKLAVSNALGSLALVSGRDEKADKAYEALEKVPGFDVDAFAYEVVRISGIGLEHMMSRPSPWPLRALATCVVEGVLKLATVGGRFGAQLRALPEDIGDIESFAGPLRGVVIEVGNIRALPPSFAKLVGLETVALPGARLDVFPTMLRGLPKLRKLSLVGELAGIEAIGAPTEAEGAAAASPMEGERSSSLATLEELDVQSSAPLPESIGGLVGLRRLRWSGSNVVPSSIGRLEQLESLDLSGGTFEALPPEVWKLPLRSLRLRGCRLAELPDGLADLTQLEKLDLSAIDNLARLPLAMSRLPKLRTLHMHSLRGVHELPPLDHLEELYMSYSAITDPVASLRACPSLKDLHISITRYSTPGFTNDQLESVRAALPHLRINVQ